MKKKEVALPTLGEALGMALTPINPPPKKERGAIRVREREDRGVTRVLLAHDGESDAALVIEMEPMKWEKWYIASDKPIVANPGDIILEGRFTMAKKTTKTTTSKPAVSTAAQTPATAMIRFFQSEGKSFAEIQVALVKLGYKVADGTIRTQMSRARRGQGAIPSFTATEKKKILASIPKEKKAPAPKAKATAKKKTAAKKPAARKPLTKKAQVASKPKAKASKAA